jgi:hypothetical protein
MASQINGFWLNGKFFPLIAGGSGEGEEEGEGAEGSEGDEGTEGAGGSGSSEGEDDGNADEGGSSDDVDALKKEIAKLRKENAKRRTDTRTAKQAKDDTERKLKAIAKALGIEDGDEPDVDALKEKLAKVSSETKSLKIERALNRAANKHGADSEALTDSRSFMKDADALDPDDDDFAGALDELVKSAVENNPKLKAGQGSTRSSGEFNGSNDDGKTMSLDAALKSGDKDKINKAMDAELKAGRK